MKSMKYISDWAHNIFISKKFSNPKFGLILTIDRRLAFDHSRVGLHNPWILKRFVWISKFVGHLATAIVS